MDAEKENGLGSDKQHPFYARVCRPSVGAEPSIVGGQSGSCADMELYILYMFIIYVFVVDGDRIYKRKRKTRLV